jgi:hypothetical protein
MDGSSASKSDARRFRGSNLQADLVSGRGTGSICLCMTSSVAHKYKDVSYKNCNIPFHFIPLACEARI